MKETKKLSIFLVAIVAMVCAFVFGASAYYGTSYDGSLYYGTLSNGDIYISDCNESVTSITIPDSIEGKSVTSIGSHAFHGCTGLTGITIPDSVTSIGYSVFSGCTSLTSITVDENNTVYDSRESCNAIIKTSTNTLITGCKTTTIPDSVTSIGDNAFRGCTGLTSITIPDSVTSIDSWAFSDCTGLTSITIPDSVTSIGEYAFGKCNSLTSIVIPDSVTSISWCSFPDCSSLKSIVVDENNTVFDSRDNCNAIIRTSNNELVRGCENTIIPDSVTSIGAYSFSGCKELKDFELSDNVIYIGQGAFAGCTSLTTFALPDGLEEVGRYPFAGCDNLKNFTIGKNFTYDENGDLFCGYMDYYGFSPDDIYYNNTEENWNKINLFPDNNPRIHFNTREDEHPWTKVTEINESETREYTYYQCECGYKKDITSRFIGVCEHSNIILKDKVEATCTSNGYSGDKVCLECDEVIETGLVINATGHNKDNGTIVTVATCISSGTKVYKCSVCGEILETKTIANGTHTKSKPVFENVIEATCTTEGSCEEVIYCSVCNEEILRVTKAIDKIAHTDADGDGICDVCNETIYDASCPICKRIYSTQPNGLMEVLLKLVDIILHSFDIFRK